MHDSMIKKLDQLQNRINEIQELLVDSKTIEDIERYTLLNKEFSELKPIVEKFEKDNSIKKILITSSTTSSSSILSKYKFKKTIHQFYPYDLNIFTKLFINYWKPKIAIFFIVEF